jgi:protein-tyrosine phosphatase
MGEESLPNREKFEQIKAILRKGNTLVHCTHGADRTGAIIGRYYVEEGIMSVDAAFADMLRYKSGSPYSSVANFVRYGPR